MDHEERTVTHAAHGPRIHGLETVRLLGSGSAAAVWLVRRTEPARSAGVRWCGWPGAEQELPRRFALKVPHRPADTVSDAEGRRRLRAELEAMRPLHHEHIVRVWGMAETDLGPGLLLDLVQAGSLYRLVSLSGGLTVGETVTVLTPVAQALAHLHAVGAAHGDVQPGNVLLAPDGRPALSDLGEAQLLGMPPAAGDAVGFRAPERGMEPVLGTAADVFGLGALGWFALTGEAPAPVRVRPPLRTLLPEAPPSMAELLEEALSEHPEGRPSAEEFARDLFRCAEPQPLDLSDYVDEEVLPELPTKVPPGGLSADRQRRRRRIGAAAGICLMSGAGWGAWSLAVGAEDTSSPEGTTGRVSEPEPLTAARGLLAGGDPEEALEGIATLRTAALEQADAELVGDYAAAESPAAEAEAELLDQMQQEGLVYEGDPLDIDPVEDQVPAQHSGDATERMFDVIVTAADFDTGAPVSQEVTLTLRRYEGRWLLAEVSPLQDRG